MHVSLTSIAPAEQQDKQRRDWADSLILNSNNFRHHVVVNTLQKHSLVLGSKTYSVWQSGVCHVGRRCSASFTSIPTTNNTRTLQMFPSPHSSFASHDFTTICSATQLS
jgi:hypothetical protein